MSDQQRRGRRLSEERTDHILGTVLDVLHDVGYDQLRMPRRSCSTPAPSAASR